MQTLSRRKMAQYIAHELVSGKSNKTVLGPVAAYMIEHKQTGQVGLLVRDVEAVLARDYKVVLAEVVSARELSSQILKSIEQFVSDAEGAKQVEVSASVDPSLLGGVIIRTPSAELDTTVRKQLNALRS